MGLKVPDELAVLDLVWSLDFGAEIAVNRLWVQHHHDTGNPFDWGDALQTMADHVATSMETKGGQILSHVNTSTYLNRIDAYQIDGDSGLAVDKRTHVCGATDVKGSASSGMLPPSTAIVIQLWGYDPATYAVHPRRRRGRLFMCGIDANCLANDGTVSGTAQSDLTAGWSAVLNDLQGMHIGGLGTGTGVPDYANLGVLSRVDKAFYQLEAVSVAHLPGVQRRRINAFASTHSTPSAISHS